MRQAVTGWLFFAGCLVLLGAGVIAGVHLTGHRELPPEMFKDWRQYASEVEQGTRTPSAVTTRMLTETAIAQHAYAKSATQLLRFTGVGIAILGLLLGVDLIRYRARHSRETDQPGSPR
jgi:hypothetical protein